MIWQTSKDRLVHHLINVHRADPNEILSLSKSILSAMHGQLAKGESCGWRR